MLFNNSFLKLDSSIILKKYKKRLKISFIQKAKSNVKSVFLITITKNIGNNFYIGFDSTSYAIVFSKCFMNENKRYEVYGRVLRGEMLFLVIDSVFDIDYKSLCYRVF
ncbi:hypothetical protein DMUE_2719 [Dictyocoela muelleri]|nr:hypothetical protein DMUE_2719 [Dictyocoela muelleri]